MLMTFEQLESTDVCVLKVGIHSGGIGSRDIFHVECNTLEACRKEFKRQKVSLLRDGQCIWFAKAYAPNGRVIVLENNPV